MENIDIELKTDNVEVELIGGARGFKGDTGSKGDKGDAFTYEDFTPQQLEGLRGPQGIQGPQGDAFTYEDFTPQQLEGLKGPRGIQGPKGDAFSIYKTYASISAMEVDKNNVPEGSFVIIASDVEQEDNGKLYVKGTSDFSFIVDMSGPQGEQGPKGDAGKGYTGPGTITSTGTNIEVETLNAKIKDYKIYGDTQQQSYTGKNILNNTMISQTSNDIVFTVNSDKSITINGTASARTEPDLWTSNDGELTLYANTTYYNYTGRTIYFHSNQYVAIYNNSSYTPTANQVIDRVYIRIENNETIDDTIFPILTTSTNNSYEPYVGGIASPNPSYPQEIKTVTGSNIVTINSTSYSIDLGNLELPEDNYIYKSNGKWYIHNVWDKINNYNGETITTDYISTTGELTSGAKVWYKLVTETDTEITNTTLINQLEALYNAHTGEDATTFTTTGSVLPPILNVTTYYNNANGVTEYFDYINSQAPKIEYATSNDIQALFEEEVVNNE